MRRRSSASAVALAQAAELQQEESEWDPQNSKKSGRDPPSVTIDIDVHESDEACSSASALNRNCDNGEQKAPAVEAEGDIYCERGGQRCHLLRRAIRFAFALLLAGYLLAAFIINFRRAIPLFVCAVLVAAWHLWVFVANRHNERFEAAELKVIAILDRTDTDPRYSVGFTLLLLLIAGSLVASTVRRARNLVGFLGLAVFLGLTWLGSFQPSKVMLRPIIFSLFLQFVFGYVVIRTPWGLASMEFVSGVFVTLLGYTNAGSSFVFGFLTDASLHGTPFLLADGGSYALGPPLFFSVLPTVIFFSTLVSVGYYLGVLPWCVKVIGRFLGLLLGTSASESLSVAGNIFVGQTEAPLMVRPYLKDMTASELHAVMTGGFATIAGSVFGIYVSFGIDPVAILAASIMSAPAALAVSKLACPETAESPTAPGKKGSYDVDLGGEGDANVVHAATNGAAIGLRLMMNIAANLVAFLALVAMLDALLGYLGGMVDVELSFAILCSWIFWPVAWLMGVDNEDCGEVAVALGYKVFANEFVAYQKLAYEFRDQISERSYYIASYALCGFSNVGSIGVQLGGLIPMAPNQGRKIAKLVVSAMIAGNTACLMTACIAGIFYEP